MFISSDTRLNKLFATVHCLLFSFHRKHIIRHLTQFLTGKFKIQTDSPDDNSCDFYMTRDFIHHKRVAGGERERARERDKNRAYHSRHALAMW